MTKSQLAKLPHVIERNLIAKMGALGLCYPNGTICIDPRQSSREYLDTLIHEHLHFCFPKLSESRVEWVAKVISKAIWKKDFRRISR